MPATALDAQTALILIDLQKGILALPAAHPPQEIVQRAGALAAAFRERELPVVLVTVAGGAPGRTEQPRRMLELPPGWADLAPELGAQAHDITIVKRTWGAFTQTALESELKRVGVSQVVIAGVATSIGVESTARQAHELGLNVTLATDAMTDLNLDAHVNSVTRIFPRLGETATTDAILELLNRRPR